MSDTSTKRAEEIAYNLQLSGVSGSTWRATEVDASNMLRSLAAERDALRAENDKLRAALLFMVKALEGYGEIDEEDHLALTAARAALGEKE